MAGSGAGVPDYYAVLGVSRDASGAEVRAAYLKLALKWHPDKQGREDPEEVTARFQEIQQAYKVLSDPSKRTMYDAGTYDPALDTDADDHVNLMNDFIGQMVATMDKEKEDDVAKIEALWGLIAEIDLSSFNYHQAEKKKKGRASTSSTSSSYSSSPSSSSSSDDPRLLHISITLAGTSSSRAAGRSAGPSSYRRRAFGHGKGGCA